MSLKPDSVRRQSVFVILLLWLAGLGAAMQFAKMSVFFADLRLTYGDGGASLGFLVSLISVMGVIFGVIAGLLVARLGYRKILLWSLVLGGAISLLQAALPPLPLMLVTRIVEGASHLGIVVAAPTLIASLSNDYWRGAAMTLWGSFFGVAFAITALFGPWLLSVGGLPAVFLAHGVWMFACAALLAPVVPRLMGQGQGQAESFSLSSAIKKHASIYRSPAISAPAWGWLFYTLTFVAGLTVLPDFLSAADATLFLAAAPIASIIFSLTIGVLLLRYRSAVGVVLIGFGLALFTAASLLLAPGSPWLSIGLFTVLGLVQGASFAAIPQLNESAEDRALSTGALAQTGNIGNLVGTPLLLLAASAAGLWGVVAFLMVAYAAGALVHLALAKARA